jgi:hypothetical protein
MKENYERQYRFFAIYKDDRDNEESRVFWAKNDEHAKKIANEFAVPFERELTGVSRCVCIVPRDRWVPVMSNSLDF